MISWRILALCAILLPLIGSSFAQKVVGDAVSQEQDVMRQDSGAGLETSFVHGFVAAFSVIIVSELGDKTFFIAAIMAMQHSRTVVLAGALGALVIMTFLSVAMGWLIHIVPRVYTFYASTILFAVVGVKLLREGLRMSADEENEELEEVAQELKKKEEEMEMSMRGDVESGVKSEDDQASKWMRDIQSGVLLQAFTMTFLAEWGDRSQITTVVLAARENVYGVAIGGCIGHAICTGIAVIGGRLLAQRISVRTVTITGGVVFILFAVVSLVQGPGE